MRIKKYVSDSMAGALRLVKADLGPRAVILNTRTVKKGGALGLGGKGQIEVTAAVDQASSAAGKSYGKAKAASVPGAKAIRQAKATEPGAKPVITAPASGSKPGAARRPSAPSRAAASSLGAVPGPPAAWVDQISRQLNELQNSVQSVAGGQLRSDAPMLLPGALGLLSAQLSEAGVAPGLSQELLTAMLMEPGQQGLKHLKPLQEQAAKILATRAGEPAVARLAKGVRTVVALVGPAGAGKTTAAARLAAHYSEQHGARTALIAADTDRVGGLEQLKAYAGILQVPVDAVYTADDMAEVIRKRRDVDLILVDTGGASPHDVEELDRLRDLLREAAPSEIHLVIGAPTGLPQMFDTIRAFTRIGADHLLLTKLDETSRLGAACTVASEAKLPLSFFTDGRNVPGNLLPADPDWLAQSLFERSPNGAAK